MKLGIMQPYLFPYIGYFQLIKAVDKYVIFDDVNYIKGGWINRNNILVNNQKHLFTIALDSSSQHKHINETEIKDNFVSLLKMIRYSYSRAPYFQNGFSLIERIFSFQESNLSRFIANSIIVIAEYLGLKTEFIMSSSLDKNITLKNQQKILHICELLKANTYINSIGGVELYDKAEFASRNIELKFLKTKPFHYKQFKADFVPGLSIIDVMMFNSPETIQGMLDSYELI